LQEEIDSAHSILDEIVALAAQRNCAIMIEVCYDNAVAPLLALVRSFNSPFVHSNYKFKIRKREAGVQVRVG